MTSCYKSYFYYPTTTVLIDDDKEFLGTLTDFFESKGDKRVKSFSDPKQVLTFIKEQNNIHKNYST